MPVLKDMRANAFIRVVLGRLLPVLLLGGVLAACEPTPEPQMDWQPPSFTVTGAGDESFRYPEDLEGPTIVLFWATWCPYCKALMPHLQSILDEFPGQVRVLALNIREDGDPAAFLAEYGYDFQLVESADRAAELWQVKGTPGLFLADAGGRVVFDRMRIPPAAATPRGTEDPDAMKHYQKAARAAPLWAAHLRAALDPLLR